MANLQQIIQQDLSKGSNVLANPFDTGQQQSVLVTNMLLDEHGTLRTRDGEHIVTTAPDTRPIVKLYDFIARTAAVIPLAIQKGPPGLNDLYNRGTTPWTLIRHLGTNYEIPDIVSFVAKFFIANGYEIPWQSNVEGTAVTPLTSSSGPVPKGAKHLAVHQGFLWLWNTAPFSEPNSFDGPTSLRSSDLNEPLKWPAANQVFIDKDDGDHGMGMAQFTIAESGISPTTSQILFKTFVTYQMTGVFGSTNPLFTIQRVKSDMGCIAPRTARFCPGFGIMRLTHRGFALFDGTDDRLVGLEVNPILFGNEVFEPVDWDKVFTSYAAVIPNPPLYVCVCPKCDVPGLTIWFVFDLVRRAWTIFDLPQPIATIATILNPVPELALGPAPPPPAPPAEGPITNFGFSFPMQVPGGTWIGQNGPMGIFLDARNASNQTVPMYGGTARVTLTPTVDASMTLFDAVFNQGQSGVHIVIHTTAGTASGLTLVVTDNVDPTITSTSPPFNWDDLTPPTPPGPPAPPITPPSPPSPPGVFGLFRIRTQFTWHEGQGPMPINITSAVSDGQGYDGFFGTVTLTMQGDNDSLGFIRKLYDANMNPLPTFTTTNFESGFWAGYIMLGTKSGANANLGLACFDPVTGVGGGSTAFDWLVP
jgi:hypothetical protein